MGWKALGEPAVRRQRDRWVVRVDGIDTTTGRRRNGANVVPARDRLRRCEVLQIMPTPSHRSPRPAAPETTTT